MKMEAHAADKAREVVEADQQRNTGDPADPNYRFRVYASKAGSMEDAARDIARDDVHAARSSGRGCLSTTSRFQSNQTGWVL